MTTNIERHGESTHRRDGEFVRRVRVDVDDLDELEAKAAALEVVGQQLRGAVDLLERAVSLIAQPTIPEHARRRWQAAVDELLGDGTTAGGSR